MSVHSVGDAIVDALIASAIETVETFTPGLRIQFYRKGYADSGKPPTIAINGTIKSIKDGVATVEHKHGTAMVKLNEEKILILPGKGTMSGNGANPQNIAKV